MKVDLRSRIIFSSVVQLVVVVGVLFGFYFVRARSDIRQQYVEKARSIILTAEATREEMGHKWDQGIFTPEQLSGWAADGELDKVLSAVPVVTAWQAAMAKSEEGGYKLRVPKFSPRNPKNEPDELETRALKKLESGDDTEYVEIDSSINAIRYFRPVRLTQECLLCHGDPATSAELWANNDGLDPTGVRMENWNVGEVHGAFEVVQSLDEADAQIAGAMMSGAVVVAILVVVGSGLFFLVLTRGVTRPISRIVEGMNQGADEVNDAARQVASSSQTVATGATEQAAALEETNAALEEVASQSTKNSEKARNANDIATQARGRANEGEQTMSDLNEAIQEINRSSSDVAKIIHVIEEIAFQTNLLALNAAVEAARAGEHGRGFAVVAEEVRSLATRSAEAARETNSLISQSVDRAREGSEVATSAAVALNAIVSDVTSVAELLEGIYGASEEQARGVKQITSAVGEMDKVTQANAAGSEESASAAEELSAQANVLKGIVEELATLVSGR